MDHGGVKNIKLFLISFASAFFLLSLLFLFLMATVHPKEPASLIAANAPEEDEYIPDPGDALTLLIFGADTTDAVAGTYLLARFDPVGGRVLVAAFPPETMLIHGGKRELLSEAYRYGGARYTRAALAEYLGIPIDRYAKVTLSGFVMAASAVGTVEFSLDEPLTLADGDAAVKLGKGTQLLDGRKVAGIIRHEGYPGGELQRCAVTAELTCAIINQRIDVARSTLCDKVFETVVNLIDTDISYVDYEQRKLAALELSLSKEPVASAIRIDGRAEKDGAFYLYDTTLADIARQML